jgi:VWFA-related protein
VTSGVTAGQAWGQGGAAGPAFALCIVAFAFGRQQPPPAQTGPGQGTVVRIVVNLVQVDAVVTDARDRPVTGLQAEDFEIYQNGRKQKITNFSYVTTGPAPAAIPVPAPAKGAPPAPPPRLRREDVRRTIALVVDDLGLSFESTAQVRDTCKKFVDEQMQPGDLVAIIRTGAGMGALQQFTADRRQLHAAVERIRWNPLGRGGIGAFAPISSGAGSDEGASAEERLDEFRHELFSVGTLGAIHFVVQGLRELPGRKSVILLSDGFKIFNRDRDNRRVLDSLQQLTDLANRASVVIYTIDTRGLQTLGLTAADNVSRLDAEQVRTRLEERSSDFFESQDGLSYLAHETGGFFIHNSNDPGDGIRRVLDDSKGYYLLGYVPDASTFKSDPRGTRFHKISVRVTRPGLHVRSRTGFFGVTDPEARPAPRTRAEQMLHALNSPFGSTGIHLRLTSLFGNDAKAGPMVRSLLHIDCSDLTFSDEPDGWHKTVVDVLALTYADNGRVVDSTNRTFTIRVRADDYRRTLKGGLIYTLNVPVQKAGAYQLRTVLRDAGSERVGSASQFIEVPDLAKGRLALSGIVLRGKESLPRAAPAAGTAADPVAGTAEGQVDEPDPQASPALRRFRRGTALYYALVVFNAQLDRTSHQPQLETQVRLFRDGRQIYAGQVRPFKINEKEDFKRLVAAGQLALGGRIEPGDYILQIVVTDKLAGEKGRTATQWIDFEVVG